MQQLDRADGYIMPAEFEPQAAIWMGWPTFQWYESEAQDMRFPLAGVIQILTGSGITVKLMCNDKAAADDIDSWLEDHDFTVNFNLQYVFINQVDIWQRDFGPIFLRNAENKLAVAGFEQNQWGYSTPTDPTSVAMSKVPTEVANYLGIKTIFSAPIVSEGGDRVVNGKGTLLVNRAVELQRNPTMDQSALEQAYKETLGVTKVIWLNDGVREDLHADWGPIPYLDKDGNTIYLYGPQSTGGHLDEFVSFATANTIILAKVSEQEAASNPISAVNYARLENAYRILSNETDQDGKPFEIIRIPSPDIEYMAIEPGERMYKYLEIMDYPADVPPFPKGEVINVVKSSSYANYLVANDIIVAPGYGNMEKNDLFRAALESAYPDRKVALFDPSPLNYAGGGIHCCTQQQPVGTISNPIFGGKNAL